MYAGKQSISQPLVAVGQAHYSIAIEQAGFPLAPGGNQTSQATSGTKEADNPPSNW